MIEWGQDKQGSCYMGRILSSTLFLRPKTATLNTPQKAGLTPGQSGKNLTLTTLPR